MNKRENKVQETTLNLLNQIDKIGIFSDVHEWLTALYNDASIKQLNKNLFFKSIINNVNFEILENNLDYSFSNKEILVQSLIQSTFTFEAKFDDFKSNERLEFFGDSIVNLIVGKELYKRFPELAEGDLSKIRGALVNEEALAKLANSICLGNYIVLGKGEWLNNGSKKNSILADAFEALMASIYIDSKENLKVVEKVFNKIISTFENKNTTYYRSDVLQTYDSKSKLQELLMSLYGEHPIYKSQELEAKDGFRVSVWIKGKKIIEETGISKKKLEKKLAQDILENKLYDLEN